MRVRAPAKINLSLRVVGVRPDGYHELRTIFQSIALHDTLTIRARRGPLALRCDDPACPVDATNLVWRAAERVWAASGRSGAPHGVEIELVKRIPLRAGLGGGSSDAAAALRAFAALWRVKADRWHQIAVSLGADVPYFLQGGRVLGLERGDLLFPLAEPAATFATVAVPPFGISTAEAFDWWDRAGGRAAIRPGGSSQTTGARRKAAIRSASAPELSGNDLQEPVATRHPEISRLIELLWRAGASEAAMSGSGSAVFGLFTGRKAAETAARALSRGGGPPLRTFVTRTLNSAAYQRLARIARIV
jgi:4-diphosphocytidyl-2-C-methyl-D-erythritol kinase